MPPELLFLTAFRDVVDIGKSLKCSWSNWFIDLNGKMYNLVLIHKLRDSTDSDVGKLLRKMLTLECVRNKDRMAVELIVRLTRPEVIEVLSKACHLWYTRWFRKTIDFGPLINKGFVVILLPSARDLLAVFGP